MRLFFSLLTSLFFIFTSTLSHFAFAENAKIAIVIDDIGYRFSDENALTLPKAVTYSILPHTPYGQKLAEQAFAQNSEVLLHIPMESTIGKKLGPGAITSDMNDTQIQQTLTAAFTEIPFAVGINNHMGSKLTQLYSPMAATMRFLKARKVLFLDSITTQHSKGEQIAKLYGVPFLHRNVFLDNQLDESYITGQFKQLMQKAKSTKFAIAIAHPHPETISALSKLLPLLAENNIDLVPLSQLLISQDHSIKISAIKH